MTKATQDDPNRFRPGIIRPAVPGLLTAIGLLAAIYAAATEPNLALQGKIFMILWLAVSVACSFLLAPRNFTAGFLTGLLALLFGWRIAGLDGVHIVAYPLLLAFIAFVLQFFDAMRTDLRRGAKCIMSTAEWQLTFIRLYIGFDLVPHATEKLFAGPTHFESDVKAFAGFGLPVPEFFVILGGLCELGIAIGIGLGLLTRLAGYCAALYFLIATLIGGHFLNGFIWADAGGGWEYPVLMMALFITFSVRGAGPFSLDGVLGGRPEVPPMLSPLMATRR
jgi:putative oxidoreductase